MQIRDLIQQLQQCLSQGMPDTSEVSLAGEGQTVARCPECEEKFKVSIGMPTTADFVVQRNGSGILLRA